MKFTGFLAVVSILASYSLTAQEQGAVPVKDPVKLTEQAQLASLNITSITCDFRQEKEMGFMEETVISSGKFYFKKEKFLRWEYTDPFSYAIILDNSRIRIVDEGKAKDFDGESNRIFSEISEIMSGMVNGTLLNSQKFRSAWFETPENYLVELEPSATAMRDYLSKILLEINRKDFSVEGITMIEKSGDFTRILFRNKKFNEEIPADIFRMD